MRKTEELTSPNSCMNRARDNEMTFVLLGRDVAAPATVRAWIDERIRLGKNAPEDPQIQEAEAWIETVSRELGERAELAKQITRCRENISAQQEKIASEEHEIEGLEYKLSQF